MRWFYTCILLAFVHLTVSGDSSTLYELDEVLTRDYVSRKVSTLDSLKRLARTSDEPWPIYYDLAGRYASFDTDSALHYTSEAGKCATSDLQQARSALQLASIYNSSLMMYKEAYDLYRGINLTAEDANFKKDYFIVGVQIYRNLERMAPQDSLRRSYAGFKRALRDSVLKIMPEEDFIRANELLEEGKADDVITLFEKNTAEPGFNPFNGALYHLMARAYRVKNDRELEKKYLALASKADIENGVREYMALPELALMLYEEGDIERAYRYMQRSLDDAKACNARVRIFDMAETFSVVSDAYAGRQKESRRNLGFLLFLVILLLLIAMVTLYYARQRNRLLNDARYKLEESNRQLETAGNVRERNVRQFMNLSREYLEKLDGYRLRLFKIAGKRNFDSLLSAIKSSDIVDSSLSTFYSSFDKAFLEIYPDFIDEFNSYLRPDERVSLKEPGSLNTDLRIFALMKLGIYESAEIARFLHCSQSTVYNYRTKYRSKAQNKEKFIRHFFPDTVTNTPTNINNLE